MALLPCKCQQHLEPEARRAIAAIAAARRPSVHLAMLSTALPPAVDGRNTCWRRKCSDQIRSDQIQRRKGVVHPRVDTYSLHPSSSFFQERFRANCFCLLPTADFFAFFRTARSKLLPAAGRAKTASRWAQCSASSSSRSTQSPPEAPNPLTADPVQMCCPGALSAA